VNRLLTTITSLFRMASAAAPAIDAPASPALAIKRGGCGLPVKGSADHFTGAVLVDPLFSASVPSRTQGSSVTFERSARTAWHAHPLGQVLIVTEGVGWVQHWGGPSQEIRPGDVVWIPPGVKHWHGGTVTTAMTHIAITEQLDGRIVQRMEKVSYEQYDN
jgi:4-carboxymuconolactone decarboxylase